ncbi:MAG: phosphate signaling complex protein PhoU [Burkholderiaceae bacterium]
MMDHTLKKFDTDIDALRSVVTTMGGLVERQVMRAVDAVRLGDLGIVDQVLADEHRVNQLHMDCDRRCIQTIARQQPAAGDLREIISIIHTNTDLERIGDEAKRIAKKTRDLRGVSMPIDFGRIEKMAEATADMVRIAIDAFVRHDIAVAALLGEHDLAVDRQRDVLIEDLTQAMSERPEVASASLALIFIAQSLERVGDHARNIAEYVVNMVEGVDLRHASQDEIARISVPRGS